VALISLYDESVATMLFSSKLSCSLIVVYSLPDDSLASFTFSMEFLYFDLPCFLAQQKNYPFLE
jgi:hypothetical protein